jgi:hypothetical protein
MVKIVEKIIDMEEQGIKHTSGLQGLFWLQKNWSPN